ncbi:unnamed protein product [Rhizoctonia solani]|uniref:Uncharacterized protein n=1 Tax=Rhizoctonia solani TaxID=456999 RepID=A0A8H3GNT9_9AGAM|nr:unnamed protein product [Rhizoctonia solani]
MPRSRRNVDGKLSAELEDTTFGTSEQFDQYGAELGKESLFWKVYVQETDKHDKEIVEKWHRQVARDSKAGRSPGQVSLSHPTCLTKVIMRFYSDCSVIFCCIGRLKALKGYEKILPKSPLKFYVLCPRHFGR